VFVVTPRLIKPLPQKIVLPTDGHNDTSRGELFFGGQLEGKATQKNNADSDSK
jgi:Flp pilus assembly secretin CpaC